MTKRDAILKAADALFARHGYGLTGVDALAAEAGVTKRTLYKQFGSKEALFAEWLRHRDVRTRGGLQHAIEAISNDPREQLLGLFTVLARLAEAPDFFGCPFSRALVELGSAGSQAAGREVAAEHKAQVTGWVRARVVAAGMTEPDQTADEIMVLYEGVLAQIAAARTGAPAYAARRLLAARLETRA